MTIKNVRNYAFSTKAFKIISNVCGKNKNRCSIVGSGKDGVTRLDAHHIRDTSVSHPRYERIASKIRTYCIQDTNVSHPRYEWNEIAFCMTCH